jgi:hypothetical protein
MTTITGEFIQDILERRGKTIGDDEILSEAERMINEEMAKKRLELKKNDNEDKESKIEEGTTVISSVMEKYLLEALEKLGETEINKEVLAEVDKMLKDDRAEKRQVLKDIIKDHNK